MSLSSLALSLRYVSFAKPDEDMMITFCANIGAAIKRCEEFADITNTTTILAEQLEQMESQKGSLESAFTKMEKAVERGQQAHFRMIARLATRHGIRQAFGSWIDHCSRHRKLARLCAWVDHQGDAYMSLGFRAWKEWVLYDRKAATRFELAVNRGRLLLANFDARAVARGWATWVGFVRMREKRVTQVRHGIVGLVFVETKKNLLAMRQRWGRWVKAVKAGKSCGKGARQVLEVVLKRRERKLRTAYGRWTERVAMSRRVGEDLANAMDMVSTFMAKLRNAQSAKGFSTWRMAVTRHRTMLDGVRGGAALAQKILVAFTHRALKNGLADWRVVHSRAMKRERRVSAILARMRMRRAVKGFHTWRAYCRNTAAAERFAKDAAVALKGQARAMGRSLWHIKTGFTKRHMTRCFRTWVSQLHRWHKASTVMASASGTIEAVTKRFMHKALGKGMNRWIVWLQEGRTMSSRWDQGNAVLQRFRARWDHRRLRTGFVGLRAPVLWFIAKAQEDAKARATMHRVMDTMYGAGQLREAFVRWQQVIAHHDMINDNAEEGSTFVDRILHRFGRQMVRRAFHKWMINHGVVVAMEERTAHYMSMDRTSKTLAASLEKMRRSMLCKTMKRIRARFLWGAWHTWGDHYDHHSGRHRSKMEKTRYMVRYMARGGRAKTKWAFETWRDRAHIRDAALGKVAVGHRMLHRADMSRRQRQRNAAFARWKHGTVGVRKRATLALSLLRGVARKNVYRALRQWASYIAAIREAQRACEYADRSSTEGMLRAGRTMSRVLKRLMHVQLFNAMLRWKRGVHAAGLHVHFRDSAATRVVRLFQHWGRKRMYGAMQQMRLAAMAGKLAVADRLHKGGSLSEVVSRVMMAPMLRRRLETWRWWTASLRAKALGQSVAGRTLRLFVWEKMHLQPMRAALWRLLMHSSKVRLQRIHDEIDGRRRAEIATLSAQRDDLEARLAAAEDEMEAAALIQEDTVQAADETARESEARVAAVDMKRAELETKVEGYEAELRALRARVEGLAKQNADYERYGMTGLSGGMSPRHGSVSFLASPEEADAANLEAVLSYMDQTEARTPTGRRTAVSAEGMEKPPTPLGMMTAKGVKRMIERERSLGADLRQQLATTTGENAELAARLGAVSDVVGEDRAALAVAQEELTITLLSVDALKQSNEVAVGRMQSEREELQDIADGLRGQAQDGRIRLSMLLSSHRDAIDDEAGRPDSAILAAMTAVQEANEAPIVASPTRSARVGGRGGERSGGGQSPLSGTSPISRGGSFRGSSPFAFASPSKSMVVGARGGGASTEEQLAMALSGDPYTFDTCVGVMQEAAQCLTQQQAAMLELSEAAMFLYSKQQRQQRSLEEARDRYEREAIEARLASDTAQYNARDIAATSKHRADAVVAESEMQVVEERARASKRVTDAERQAETAVHTAEQMERALVDTAAELEAAQTQVRSLSSTSIAQTLHEDKLLVASLNAENEKTREELEAASATKADAEDRAEKLEEILSRITEERNDLDESCASFEQQLAEREAADAHTKRRLELVEVEAKESVEAQMGRVASLETMLTEAREEKEKADAEAMEKALALSDATSRAAQMELRVQMELQDGQLKAQALRDRDSTVTRLHDQLARVEEERKVLEVSKAMMEQQLETESTALAETNRVKFEMSSELETERSEMMRIREEMEDAVTSNTDTARQLMADRVALETMQMRLEEVEADREYMSERVGAVEGERDKALSAENKLRGELHEERHSMMQRNDELETEARVRQEELEMEARARQQRFATDLMHLREELDVGNQIAGASLTLTPHGKQGGGGDVETEGGGVIQSRTGAAVERAFSPSTSTAYQQQMSSQMVSAAGIAAVSEWGGATATTTLGGGRGEGGDGSAGTPTRRALEFERSIRSSGGTQVARPNRRSAGDNGSRLVHAAGGGQVHTAAGGAQIHISRRGSITLTQPVRSATKADVRPAVSATTGSARGAGGIGREGATGGAGRAERAGGDGGDGGDGTAMSERRRRQLSSTTSVDTPPPAACSSSSNHRISSSSSSSSSSSQRGNRGSGTSMRRHDTDWIQAEMSANSQLYGRVRKQLVAAMSSGVRRLFGKPINTTGAMFDALDRDGGGTITLQELQLGMTRMDIGLSDAQVERLLGVVDSDHDKTIDRLEFTTFIHILLGYDHRTQGTQGTKGMQKEALFAALDTNGDGVISKEEFMEATQTKQAKTSKQSQAKQQSSAGGRTTWGYVVVPAIRTRGREGARARGGVRGGRGRYIYAVWCGG